MNLRANFDYSIQPDFNLDNISITAQRKFGENVKGRADFSYNMSDSNVMRLGLGADYDSGKYLVGVETSIDSENNYYAGIRFSTSLSPDATGKYKIKSQASARNGIANAYGYLDDNNNGIEDEGEEILTDINFRRYNKAVPADEDGYTHITGLSSNKYNLIRVDEDSIDDPYMRVANPRYSLLARSGRAKNIAVPVIRVSELEGNLYHDESPLSGVSLILSNDKGDIVAKTHTEYDGYYLFENLASGKYFLQIDGNHAKKLGLKDTPSTKIAIPNSGDSVYQDVQI